MNLILLSMAVFFVYCVFQVIYATLELLLWNYQERLLREKRRKMSSNTSTSTDTHAR